MFKLGVDCYLIDARMIDVIRTCKKNEVDCFDIKNVKHGIQVCFHIKDRNKVKQLFPNAKYLYTNGILGMFLRNFTKKERIISYLCVIALWVFYSTTLFEVNVYGESDTLDDKMYKTMDKYMYHTKDVDGIKKQLLSTYKSEISWLEVYEKGSSINVRYALKKHVTDDISDNQPLIAKKDGMIAYFECDEGYKLKKVKDVVKAGEVLVDNKMPNSFNQEVQIDANGKVYAYTWQQVNVEMDDNKMPEALNYYSLLLEARNQIDIEIENDEEIVKENVLHFSKNKGKINLVILYTLLEDITS